jgi:hypothetical protein
MSRSIRPHKAPSAVAPTPPTPHVSVATLSHPQLPSAPRLPDVGPAPALDLFAAAPASGPGLFDALVELAGPGSLTIHQALTLWQREQDRVLNRAWRRPGGLARSPTL